ncbi:MULTISPECIES: HD-GYP domain-containing protein [unclassified Treponema]|uniref:HD-GYP domain-containing protein n=1 Tax=unclassified Treponema TaxID=2638727 RepID=UPI0020A4BF00|nr:MULTISPECIES: HD-GYP domain-containing protein [unclassified Treponema]UTC68424.1 HD-GYP domain-containing protein [Treponema sp. OMZ 789]UTC68567.1 HD-GYP domain-containing protein [Treponema sp. OMZ 790]UTC71297.1 HD-GYP domain-containing protein [Treponema sp. OMZ 791]
MNTYNAEQTKDLSFFNKNVYLDKKFLLLIPETPLTAELKAILNEWDFSLLYSDGEPSSFMTVRPDRVSSSGKDVLDSSKENEILSDKIKKQKEIMEEVENKFWEFLRFTDKIFTDYTMKKILDPRFIFDRIKELCDFVKTDKKNILLIEMQKYSSPTNYLVMHSLRSSIFAIIIGLQLKMPPHRLIELGAACLLHEIGMFRLPPQYYMYDAPLSEEGKKALFTHPVLSYNILKTSSFSLPICLGVLEHHERENGQGYPRGLTKEKISMYGKIIAVACSYEAATAPRPYKEAQDASSSIVEMIKNTNGQYDETILKALLYSLSFYPVGMYVHLSNGKIAKVIDVNPNDPRFPIVQIYGKTTPMGDPVIVQTKAREVTVKRQLSKEELKSIDRNTI